MKQFQEMGVAMLLPHLGQQSAPEMTAETETETGIEKAVKEPPIGKEIVIVIATAKRIEIGILDIVTLVMMIDLLERKADIVAVAAPLVAADRHV